VLRHVRECNKYVILYHVSSRIINCMVDYAITSVIAVSTMYGMIVMLGFVWYNVVVVDVMCVAPCAWMQ
jgi:hypothetical protein